MADLRSAVRVHNDLRDQLKAVYGLENDEQTLTDTLDGISDLDEALAEVVREAQRAEAMADAVEAIMDANKARKARHEARAERLRLLVAQAMGDAGLKTLRAPDLTVSYRVGRPKVVIVEEGSLSAEFVRTITTTKPDMASIKAAIDRGDVPSGVRIDNGSAGITVRAL